MKRLGLAVTLVALAAACGGEAGSEGRDQAARGRELAEERGCLSCHSTDGSDLVGPTWKGLYGRSVELADGSTVSADDAYLRESIERPSAKTVKGYPEGVMAKAIPEGSLSRTQVDVLVGYIRSLR